MITLQEWIAALRSGKYKQGFGALFDPGTQKYCCLGVGCKLAGLPLLSLNRNFDTMSHPKEAFISDLPEVMKADSNSVIVDDSEGNQNDVVDLNDVFGLSFTEIADRIEKTARKYGWNPND